MKRHIVVLLCVLCVVAIPCYTLAETSSSYIYFTKGAIMEPPKDIAPFHSIVSTGPQIKVSHKHDNFNFELAGDFWVISKDVSPDHSLFTTFGLSYDEYETYFSETGAEMIALDLQGRIVFMYLLEVDLQYNSISTLISEAAEFNYTNLESYRTGSQGDTLIFGGGRNRRLGVRLYSDYALLMLANNAMASDESFNWFDDFLSTIQFTIYDTNVLEKLRTDPDRITPTTTAEPTATAKPTAASKTHAAIFDDTSTTTQSYSYTSPNDAEFYVYTPSEHRGVNFVLITLLCACLILIFVWLGKARRVKQLENDLFELKKNSKAEISKLRDEIIQQKKSLEDSIRTAKESVYSDAAKEAQRKLESEVATRVKAEKRAFFSSLYWGKNMRDLVKVPRNTIIGDDGLPCNPNSEHWGPDYTVYITNNGQCYHKKSCHSLITSRAKPVHIYNAPDLRDPCSICCSKSKEPDFEWFESYKSIMSIAAEYNIKIENTRLLSKRHAAVVSLSNKQLKFSRRDPP